MKRIEKNFVAYTQRLSTSTYKMLFIKQHKEYWSIEKLSKTQEVEFHIIRKTNSQLRCM